jgi:hypothetical protein
MWRSEKGIDGVYSARGRIPGIGKPWDDRSSRTCPDLVIAGVKLSVRLTGVSGLAYGLLSSAAPVHRLGS